MRLGDLDALKEEIGSWGMNDYEPSDFIDAIDSAPTIEGETIYFISDACYFDGQNTWHDDTRVNHSRPYLTDVIAWMSRPEPYTEKKNTNFYTKRFNEVN